MTFLFKLFLKILKDENMTIELIIKIGRTINNQEMYHLIYFQAITQTQDKHT